MISIIFVPSARLIGLISDTQKKHLVLVRSLSEKSQVLFFADSYQGGRKPTEEEIGQWIQERLQSSLLALAARARESQKEIIIIDGDGCFTDKVMSFIVKWLALDISAENFTTALNLLSSELYQWANENKSSAKQLSLRIKDDGQLILEGDLP